jgi:hypothetical protein
MAFPSVTQGSKFPAWFPKVFGLRITIGFDIMSYWVLFYLRKGGFYKNLLVC